ncbi:MAG: sugar ABC transporter permease, partial [Lachnospiraceae bacterium]|nr:sugar ABC transporter permease [Lachnospiraceae bacterium]
MNKVLGNKKAISLFVVPALIVYTIIVMVPVIWSMYYSFFSGSPGLKWEFAGLDNYARLFKDKNFLNSLMVNCKYVVVTTIGQVGMGLLLALMFKFWLKRCKTFVRTLVFFPVVL